MRESISAVESVVPGMFGLARAGALAGFKANPTKLHDGNFLMYKNGLYVSVAAALWGSSHIVNRHDISRVTGFYVDSVSDGLNFLKEQGAAVSQMMSRPHEAEMFHWVHTTVLERVMQENITVDSRIRTLAAGYYPDQR